MEHENLARVSYEDSADSSGMNVLAGCLGRSSPKGLFLILVCLLCGCASTHPRTPSRRFDFSKDTFAYANELVWEYSFNTNGDWTTHRRDPPPEYSLHCFVVARSACQFFENARFDPEQPRTDDATYRELVRRVTGTNPRKPIQAEDIIVIPGYPDLRSFSKDHGKLLKEECGGAWQSYFQRGNWRMIFPFTRHQQLETARRIKERTKAGWPALVHLVRFPQLTINHTVLIYGVNEEKDSLSFDVYDPNQPGEPVILRFDQQSNTFIMPRCAYFPGGRVDGYEIGHKWDY